MFRVTLSNETIKQLKGEFNRSKAPWLSRLPRPMKSNDSWACIPNE